MRYRDLVEDGHVPGLLVHPDWWEPRHPQELPVDTSDAVSLWRPTSELSVNAGEFDELPQWQAFIISDCPATPDNLTFAATTTLAEDAIVGSFNFALEDAVTYEGYVCTFIELDGGGWFRTKTKLQNLSPSFVLLGVLPFAGTASAGNDVFIGVNGSGDPLLNGSFVFNP